MEIKNNWIWLDPVRYPEKQKGICRYSPDAIKSNHCCAVFRKKYVFEKKIVTAEVNVSGDTSFRLCIGGKYICRGPACAGGNHDGSLYYDDGFTEGESYGDTVPCHYYNTLEVHPESKEIDFFSVVYQSPAAMDETSSGSGGFFLAAKLTFDDGSVLSVGTDETWECALRRNFISPNERDYRRKDDDFSFAKISNVRRFLRKSQVPFQAEERIDPVGFSSKTVLSQKTERFIFEFDKIYSGEICLDLKAKDNFEVNIGIFEVSENTVTWEEKIVASGNVKHEMMRFTGVGGVIVEIKNNGKFPVVLADLYLNFIHYPVDKEGYFRCSDKELETIYNVSKHTLKICRQTHSLDSPKHRENLGCTGDYYIESLMNAMTFGDMRLYRFDIVRTAEMLTLAKGKMFHTSYSLIWVMMMYDYYKFTGDKHVFYECESGLDMLFERFASYLNSDGIIENPPDYMFVDWIFVDGFNMHHPPKALGQTVLNAFYYGALKTAEKIYTIIGSKEKAEKCAVKSEKLFSVFDKYFYDKEKGLYFEGTNTETKPVCYCNPQNPDKRYFGVHSNTLAVLYGLCDGDKAVMIMEKVLNDETLITCQPYFMHFVIEATKKVGLFDKYGVILIKRWNKLIKTSTKALREGWIDMPGYAYDFSHAWGGTPAYQLPSKFIGLEIIKPGYAEITLSPKLYGLDEIEISIPTPKGDIFVKKTVKDMSVKVPESIKYTIL